MSACIISPSEYVHTFYRPVSHAVRINMCLYQPVSYRRQNKHVPLPACRIAVGTCTCLYQPVSCRCQNMYVPLSACFMSLSEYVRAFIGLCHVAVRICTCLYRPVSCRCQNMYVPLSPVSCRCQNMYVPLSACFMSLTEYVRAFTGLWYVAVS